jgi:hypothetical protein
MTANNIIPIIADHWRTFDYTVALLILVTYILVDGMYAYYTIAVVEKKPLLSANVGSAMHFIIAFGVINYVHNFLYIIPIAIGSWIGTYLVVKRSSSSSVTI